MPNQTFYGLNQWVGSDVASTALTDTTNSRLLDAAAGHVWQVSSGTNAEAFIVLVNAVSPTGVATATVKAATPSALLSYNAQGLFQLFASPTAGTAGGLVTWPSSPFFSVSPTGTATAVVSFSGLNTTSLSSAIAGVSTPTTTASDGFLYIPRLVSTPTGTPTVQPGYVALVATSQTLYINSGATATWYTPVTVVATGAAIMGITQKKGSNAGNYSTTNTTMVDVDATNLAITVTIPTGWKAYFSVSALLFSATPVNTNWQLFDTQGSVVLALQNSLDTLSTTAGFSSHLEGTVPGDGLSHTVKVQWDAAAAGTVNMQNSGGAVPVMTMILMPSN